MRANAGVSFPALPKTSIFTSKPVDSMSAHAKAVSSTMLARGLVGRYASMLVNPFSAVTERYPDDAIIPTGTVRLNTSDTYTVSASGDFRARLASKVYAASCIWRPQPVASAALLGDYGASQASWVALSSIDRTLACALRLRVVGLPSGIFLPAGTIYFLQAQGPESVATFDNEAECISAVTARKGFSLTLNELNSLGAVHLPLLPQGPMSFVFSDSNSALTGPLVGPLANPPALFVLGFGLPVGATLRIDYTHHVEYIPNVPAAGLISTSVQLPSAPSRDSIAAASQAVQATIAGATSGVQVKHLVGSASSSPSILSSLGEMVRTAANPFGSSAPSGAFSGAGGGGGGYGMVPPWMKSAMGLLSAAGI